MSLIFRNLKTLGDVEIAGNLTVKGTTVSVDSEIVQINDNHLYLNNNYTSNIAQTGGLVVNYFPQEEVLSNVAGAAFTSKSTVEVDTNISGYTSGDFIQISGTPNGVNDGVYEVSSYVAPVITITVTEPNDFTKRGFVVDTTVVGTITRVSLSIIRCGTDGVWETANGSNVGFLTFRDILLTPTGDANPYDGYAYLPGRPGGQNLIGGNDNLQNLTLTPNNAGANGAVVIASSTANATDKDTGALIVESGGLGVELAVFAGGSVSTSTGFLGNSLDSLTSDSLYVGSTTATSVEIAKVGTTTKIAGDLRINDSLDTINAEVLQLGPSEATLIEIAKEGITTNVRGILTINGILDTVSPLRLGPTTAQWVEIAQAGVHTNVLGSLAVSEITTFNKPIKIPVVNDASTTTQTPTVEELNAFTRFTGIENFTYALPDMSSGGGDNDGLELTFYKKENAGSVTIESHVSDTGGIEGQSTLNINGQYDRVTIRYIYDDRRWIIV